MNNTQLSKCLFDLGRVDRDAADRLADLIRASDELHRQAHQLRRDAWDLYYRYYPRQDGGR